MRILHSPDVSAVTAALPLRQNPAVPAESWERLVDALREKIRGLEERLQALEQAPKRMPPAIEPAPTLASPPHAARLPHPELTLDAEAFKKNLLTKMWKYLNDDERPAKEI